MSVLHDKAAVLSPLDRHNDVLPARHKPLYGLELAAADVKLRRLQSIKRCLELPGAGQVSSNLPSGATKRLMWPA